MEYFLTFLEGILSFLSPCTLPLLPVYIGYFAGASGDDARKPLPGALAFVAGFTVVFCALGVFAGSVGRLLIRYQNAVNLVCGAIVILLGLSFLEWIHIPFFRGTTRRAKIQSAFSAFLFGMVYSVSLTPCAGAFLGAALMLASSSGNALRGAALLLLYALGLGVPFVLSAVLIDQLKDAFALVKRHYHAFQIVCGAFLILSGVAMATGTLNRAMTFFSGV
ncbi:MAG: sulfite exporter TauE/SafE family protein [Oscillibacter sp.]|nr:sulfite exporter TauE/SafE family protein [Oscillibacter sp.]